MSTMKRRFFQKLRVAILATAFLAASTPAWAKPTGGIITTGFGVYLEGVDRYGCLTDCGGQCATFCALLNTCTGEFVGSAKGCVANKSRCPEFYFCVNFFNDCCINVAASLYTVSSCGNACYVAIGCVGPSNGGDT
jgi:hypothetical protein